ncbi:hypothetical protein CHU_0412 [Cytophaga hutchinsonii ATCC 33406]|uniref:Uncharacterized protein n=2 Tax=Cytophaga hutchinsonii TaxID=985 RepID=A0A6N4SN70_CYTH3|nr:hypothetical protein CHU_0412 [Cytophaga hutchinsonii ATCC 33406]
MWRTYNDFPKSCKRLKSKKPVIYIYNQKLYVMEPITTNAKILKINHAILTEAAMFNHSLFDSLVLSMYEHIKERNSEVEIYTEEFNGEETEHLFDAPDMLDTWLKTTYPNNI